MITSTTTPRIVAFGPSLVDVHVRLSDESYVEQVGDLGLEPGDWAPIDSIESAHKLTRQLTGLEIGDLAADVQPSSPNVRRVGLAVGSSLLNILAAMPEELRATGRLLTAHAVNDGDPDPLATFFSETVSRLGIEHRGMPIEGHNPVGFVISGEAVKEKTMMAYPGVAADLQPQDSDVRDADLILVDAYELRHGTLAAYLDNLVTTTDKPVALSLGNQYILSGDLQRKIRNYIDTGRIAILCGNEEEYGRIFPELDPALSTRRGFQQHPIKDLVRFALITHGAHGLSAFFDGTHYSGNGVQVPSTKIKNTAGAGDTAMGVYVSGILLGHEPEHILRGIARQASEVIQIEGGILDLER